MGNPLGKGLNMTTELTDHDCLTMLQMDALDRPSIEELAVEMDSNPSDMAETVGRLLTAGFIRSLGTLGYEGCEYFDLNRQALEEAGNVEAYDAAFHRGIDCAYRERA